MITEKKTLIHCVETFYENVWYAEDVISSLPYYCTLWLFLFNGAYDRFQYAKAWLGRIKLGSISFTAIVALVSTVVVSETYLESTLKRRILGCRGRLKRQLRSRWQRRGEDPSELSLYPVGARGPWGHPLGRGGRAPWGLSSRGGSRQLPVARSRRSSRSSRSWWRGSSCSESPAPHSLGTTSSVTDKTNIIVCCHLNTSLVPL